MSDDEFECKPLQEFSGRHGDLKFKLEVLEFETKSCFELRGTIVKGNNQIGNLEGYLVNRCWQNNFYTDCDAVSDGMQLMSNMFFYNSGAPRKHRWNCHLTQQKLKNLRTGGLLFIEKIFVEKSYRGKDAGFHMLKFVHDALKGQWNIAIIEAGYYYDDDHLTDEEKEGKHKNIVILFLRIGYSSLNSKHGFYFLIPEKISASAKNGFNSVKIEMPVNGDKKHKMCREVNEFLSVTEDEKSMEKIKNKIREFKDTNPNMDFSNSGILHMAANHSCYISLFKCLLEDKSIDFNCRNEIGDAPLHSAARGGNLSALEHLLARPEVDMLSKDIEGLTAYELLISKIDSNSCFLQAMGMPAKKGTKDYKVAHLLMPPAKKENFVEGIVSKRMFVRMRIKSEVESDMMNDAFTFHTFQRGVRESIDDLGPSFYFLYTSIPSEEFEEGVHKTFVMGFHQVLETVSFILSRGQLPTKSRIISGLSATWPPSYRHYFGNGGRLEFVLKGLFDYMYDSSYSHGDGDFEDTFDEDLEAEPETEFDNDYFYLNTFVLEYLLNH